MAEKKKYRGGIPPVEYRFKPGQSGNPKGKPKGAMSVAIPKVLKQVTLKIYEELIELVVSGNVKALRKMEKDPEVSVLQVAIARSFRRALLAGDWDTIERILQRLVGKIPDELNINSKNLNLNANGAIDRDKLKEAIKKLQGDV